MAWCALQGDLITACRSICSFTGPAVMSLLSGTSAQPSGIQLPAARVPEPWESTGPFLPSVPHRKVTLNVFIGWAYCVNLLLFMARCWILIRRLLGFMHCPWEKHFLSLCTCLPVLSCVCVFLISADCKLH